MRTIQEFPLQINTQIQWISIRRGADIVAITLNKGVIYLHAIVDNKSSWKRVCFHVFTSKQELPPDVVFVGTATDHEVITRYIFMKI